MTVYELNRDQLTELKQNYYTQLLDEQGETPSMQELADIDEYVSDAEIYAEYGDTDFVPDDFSCCAGQDEDEFVNFFMDVNANRSKIAKALRVIADDIDDGVYGGFTDGIEWSCDKIYFD